MSTTVELPPAAATPVPAQPLSVPTAPANAAPPGMAMGRRWSDGGSFVPTDPNAPWTMAHQWPNLVAALSEQAVESSNLLLRALNYLVGAGRLRRTEAKALSDAMHQLRGTSLRAQQITRLASGRIRQAQERLDLSDLIRRVVDERAPELAAAGVAVRTELDAVDVLLDPPVAISLLNSVLDWALSFSKDLTFTLAASAWPSPAQLVVRVKTPAPQGAAPGRQPGWVVRPRGRRLNDGLHWMLLRQTAASSGLTVTRTSADGAAVLTIEFPKTFLSNEGVACLELSEPAGGTSLQEAWVLILARDERVRAEAVEALRRMGIDAVGARDAQEAQAACGDSRPNVLVSGYDVPADEVAHLRQNVLGGEERCPLVEITRDLPTFHLNGLDRFETPKVGREQLTSELPPAVLFELVKVG
jgi:hypothetical protein